MRNFFCKKASHTTAWFKKSDLPTGTTYGIPPGKIFNIPGVDGTTGTALAQANALPQGVLQLLG